MGKDIYHLLAKLVKRNLRFLELRFRILTLLSNTRLLVKRIIRGLTNLKEREVWLKHLSPSLDKLGTELCIILALAQECYNNL